MPRNIFDSLADPLVVDHFGLDVQGLEGVTFSEASGFGSSNEVVEHRESSADGKQHISKQAGNMKWDDIVLKRGVTDSKELYEWRKQVEDGQIDLARKSGSVVFYDARDMEIRRVSFVRGWPSKWKVSDVKVADNNALIEEITISHEGFSPE